MIPFTNWQASAKKSNYERNQIFMAKGLYLIDGFLIHLLQRQGMLVDFNYFFFPFSKRHHRRKFIQETISWNFLILLWWLLCTYYQLYCPIIFLRNHLCQGGTVRDRNLTHVPKKREEFIFSVILIVTKKTI